MTDSNNVRERLRFGGYRNNVVVTIASLVDRNRSDDLTATKKSSAKTAG